MRKELIIILVACLLTRLPQLLSPNLFLDGDEAIVGLMAKHFSEGKELPFYFYGQSYGFSFLEMLPISISFLIFGVSALAVKLPMLLLFSIGALLFYATLKQFPTKNKWVPLLVTLLFVCSPVWAVWSLKARGGYISAFFLFPLFTYLLFGKRSEKSIAVNVVLGLLLITIFESQPLWLPGMAVFAAYRLFQLRSMKFVGAQLAGVVAGFGLFQILKSLDTQIKSFHSPRVFEFPEDLGEKVMSIPEYIYINFTGSYYLGDAIAPDKSTAFFAWTLLGALVLAFAFIVYLLAKRQWNSQLLFVSALPVIMSIGVSVFLIGYSARYLLPLSGFTFFMFALILSNIDKKKMVNGAMAFFILAGCFSLVSFKDYQFENGSPKQLKRAIRSLESNGVKYVFSQGGLLQWQLMFYSNESLVARYRYNTDRYIPYVEAVNEGLKNEPKAVALMGPYNPNIPQNAPNIWTFGTEYFTFIQPNKEMLLKSGFKFD